MFSIPIDDHIVVRGHAVFDTGTIVNGYLYRHRVHVDRLFESAEKAGLDLAFLMDSTDDKDDIEKQKDRVVEIEKQVAKAGGVKNGMIRMWLTAGPGNLGVTKAGCVTSLYMVCYHANPFWISKSVSSGDSSGPELIENLTGITEKTISAAYPMKNRMLATMKSSNYLMNALGSTEATAHGGRYGIWVDPVTDEVYESSVRNVVFVLKDGTFITPPFREGLSKILKGCTVRRIVELAKEHLLGKEDGLVKKVVTEEVVYRNQLVEVGIKEMFLTSGDTHIDAITTWDNLVLSEDHKPGPVFKQLAKILYEEVMSGDSPYHEKIQYH